MHHSKTNILASIALTAAACGGAPAPTEKLVKAEAAIRGAQEVGASKVPRAQLHVKLAQEQVEKAKALMASGDNERASSLLGRAKADAELALSLAKEDNAKQEAQKALDDVKALKEKIK